MSGLFVKCGRRYRAATPSEVCETASAYVFLEAARERAYAGSPQAAVALLRAQAGVDREQFGVVYLDSRHRVITIEILFQGTSDGASVHPREIARAALKHGASALIIFHQHPSGNPAPSNADEAITERVKQSLELLDLRLIDHIIIGGDGHYSFASAGNL